MIKMSEKNYDTIREYKSFSGFKGAVTKALRSVYGHTDALNVLINNKSAREVLEQTGSAYIHDKADDYYWGFDLDFDTGRIYVYERWLK